jgi:protein sidekick
MLVHGICCAFGNTQLVSVSGFSKQVKQKVTGTSLVIQTLEEEVTYTFSVRALTIDYGPAVTENVTTGPQDGSPAKLKDLVMSKSVSSVDMRWKNGPSGKGPILGYYIESKRKGKRHNVAPSVILCAIALGVST